MPDQNDPKHEAKATLHARKEERIREREARKAENKAKRAAMTLAEKEAHHAARLATLDPEKREKVLANLKARQADKAS